jgi:DNA end-binding protein Ku
MASRPIWKGVLKISLVRIPVKVFPATDTSQPLSFNQLHAKCQTRIQQKRWCATCDREVPSDEIVKGFEFEVGKYVLLKESDFDAVRTESARVIDLQAFADVDALDPMFVDRTYYLAPDGAGQGYACIASALRGQGSVGIGKVALYGREYLVAVRVLELAPRHFVLVLHTLHHAGELRSADALEELAAPLTAKASDVKLARQVIAALTGPLDLADFTDDYQAGLRRLIDQKVAGEEIVVPPPVPALRSSSLLEDLLRSVALSTKKRPAKATAKRKSVA